MKGLIKVDYKRWKTRPFELANAGMLLFPSSSEYRKTKITTYLVDSYHNLKWSQISMDQNFGFHNIASKAFSNHTEELNRLFLLDKNSDKILPTQY